jgi:hypothetical protein
VQLSIVFTHKLVFLSDTLRWNLSGSETSMSFEQYKERLKQWTRQAAEREGNVNALQQSMTVALAPFKLRAPAPQHLYRWHDGDISDKVKDPTLTKVGIYRALKEFNVPEDQVEPEKVREETRNWLEGTSLQVKPKPKAVRNHPAFKYLDSLADKDESGLIPELIIFLVEKWRIKTGDSAFYEGGYMPANAVSDLVSGALEEGALEKTGLTLDRLQEIASGELPTLEELKKLAPALPGEWSAQDLADLLSSDLGYSIC